MIQALKEQIEQINDHYDLEIDLAVTESIYGSDVLASMADMTEEVVNNIEYLVELGFAETVSDICNRFGPALIEDRYLFRDKVDRMLSALGPDAIEKAGEDMSCWEELM